MARWYAHRLLMAGIAASARPVGRDRQPDRPACLTRTRVAGYSRILEAGLRRHASWRWSPGRTFASMRSVRVPVPTATSTRGARPSDAEVAVAPLGRAVALEEIADAVAWLMAASGSPDRMICRRRRASGLAEVTPAQAAVGAWQPPDR